VKVLSPLFAVIILSVLALVGVELAGWHVLFGVVLPYLAAIAFVLGVGYRVVKWARSPVPFCIPTTCGQQKSLPWIEADNLENPHNLWGVLKRMALEVFLFRSLFRNTRAELKEGLGIAYPSSKWLWLGGLAFHWALFLIVFRHLRFFMEPVPSLVSVLEGVDGVFQIGLPSLYLTDLILVAALSYLCVRRIVFPQLRYISLANDYFPLFLLLGIALTGILMRHVIRVDVVLVKELTLGLVGFHPVVPAGLGVIFFIHLFLVCTLVAYFPFSKLMHMAGVFLSPTRNMVNDSRRRRHLNPWNHPVKVHSYQEWEDEFRDVLKASGYPLEKE
jgi:nitrate reductase gamma subunit